MNFDILHHVYALLDEDNVVRDIVYASSEDEALILAERAYVYGTAFCIDDYPVSINDFYANKKFYHLPEDKDYFIEVVKHPSLFDIIDLLKLIIEERNALVSYLEKKLNDSRL